MHGIKMKAGIAGMAVIAVYLMISTIPNKEAHAAACPGLPDVAWWKSNHTNIVQYVNQHYNGSWDSYIAKWKNYRDKMKAIHDKMGTAIIKSRGVRLKGKSLEKHISDVEKRISITNCLKEKHGGRLAAASYQPDGNLSIKASGVAVVLQAAKRHAIFSCQVLNLCLHLARSG